MTDKDAEKLIAEEERLKKELEQAQIDEARLLRTLTKRRAYQQKLNGNPYRQFLPSLTTT